MGEKEAAFINFLARYGKTYASKGDMAGRFEVFSQNYDAVQAHNSAGERYQMGINQFSDMTLQEFSSMYGVSGLVQKQSTKASRPNLRDAKDQAKPALPDLVDWHAAGKTTVPSD